MPICPMCGDFGRKSIEIPMCQIIPRIPIKNSKYIEHIMKDGARYHVISYDNFGQKCSEPNCIINKKYKANIRKNNRIGLI